MCRLEVLADLGAGKRFQATPFLLQTSAGCQLEPYRLIDWQQGNSHTRGDASLRSVSLSLLWR